MSRFLVCDIYGPPYCIYNPFFSLIQLADHLQETLASANGTVNNHKLFTDEIIYTKICFYTSLRLLAALFSWPDFENDKNELLLKGLFSNCFPQVD
jgi:hypothetical protein